MGLSPDLLSEAIFRDVWRFSAEVYPLGEAPPGSTYKQVASTQLRHTLLKKYITSSDVADTKSYNRFLTSNKRCKFWELQVDTEVDRLLLGEFQKEIDNFFHPNGQMLFSSYHEILDKFRTGPGSAVGARGQSFYAKLFSSLLSTTSWHLYGEYRRYVSMYPRFLEAECLRRETFGAYDVVAGNRLSFVPKTSDESRMICVEPSLNMIFQLGLGAILTERLRSISIDLARQPEINRRLSHIGSRDDSFVTIDLSCASDSISLGFCKTFLPGWFYDTLIELRSPTMQYGNENVTLDMISTMGNGFTFPLQTIIFSCMIRAAHRVSGVPVLDGSLQNWSCFGDDLICEKQSFSCLRRLLSITGFTLNSSKTFFEGPFRESCGTDWFYGQPVRGVYIRKLHSKQDIFIAINLLNAWSAYTGIALFNAIQYLRSGLQGFVPLIPLSESIDAGIRIPSIHIQRFRLNRNKTPIYRCYVPHSHVVVICDGTIRVPHRSKKLLFNPPGLELSFLYGELVNYKIPVRHDRVNYSLKLRCCPNWDYIDGSMLTNGLNIDRQQWETAVTRNWVNP